MGKYVSKIEPVKLTRVTEKESLPTSPLRAMSDEKLEARYDALCRGSRNRSPEFWALHKERGRRLDDGKRERDVMDSAARAEIAARRKSAAMDDLTSRAIEKPSTEELNNTPEFSFLEGRNDLEKW